LSNDSSDDEIGTRNKTEIIFKILVKDLGRRKICARFVPYCVTDERKALRMQAYQELIQSVANDDFLLDSVVASDETCCFQ
jgi:hypothetical protein